MDEIANATEEFFVRNRPLYEVVGQMGFWGVIINGCQAAGLEHKLMTEVVWDGATSAYSLECSIVQGLTSCSRIAHRLHRR